MHPFTDAVQFCILLLIVVLTLLGIAWAAS